jgi:hypothetical protein
MKTSDFLKIVMAVGFITFSLPVFADTVSDSDQPLSEVACRYEMKVTSFSTPKPKAPFTTAWFFWRKPNIIQTQDADGDHGEIWERTANGSIQYRKLYHIDKTAVEYMPTDMPANNMKFDWFKLSGMLSKEELNTLKLIKIKSVLGRNAELRKGNINGQALEVLWLPNENLPASIIRKDKKSRMELRLIDITPLSASAKKPVALEEISDYRHIDAADFGDMENDPFVKKLMSAEGHHHH